MFGEPTLPAIPRRVSDHGPDGSEDEPTILSRLNEAREALDKVEAALKEQSVTTCRRKCLDAIEEADIAVDAAWNLILDIE